MSETMKGNVMEEMEKNGIDVTATLDNLINKFPDLIVYEKKNTGIPNENEKADNESNKNKESHKTCNECNNCYNKEVENNNKCNCSKGENDNTECQEDGKNETSEHIIIGPFGPVESILMSLQMINENLCGIGDMVKRINSEELPVSELIECDAYKGVSKKKLKKMLKKQRNEILDSVEDMLDEYYHMFLRRLDDNNQPKNNGSKKK